MVPPKKNLKCLAATNQCVPLTNALGCFQNTDTSVLYGRGASFSFYFFLIGRTPYKEGAP